MSSGHSAMGIVLGYMVLIILHKSCLFQGLVIGPAWWHASYAGKGGWSVVRLYRPHEGHITGAMVWWHGAAPWWHGAAPCWHGGVAWCHTMVP